MDPAIRALYNYDIFRAAVANYDLDPAAVSELGGFESFIYAFSRNGDDFVLRVGHDSRRPPDMVRGEIDWLNYLHAGGAGVARAVPSARGNLVETVPDANGGHFLATAFDRAQGRRGWQVGWTPERYETYGRLIGRIHRLSKDYAPGNPDWRRPPWDDDSNSDALHTLPPEETVARARYEQVLAEISELPQDGDSLGLIHQDAHEGNFLMTDDGRITLFDFDDCVYHWFAFDIAMVSFYKVTMAEDMAGLTAEFMPPFLTGYAQENALDPFWLSQVPLFHKLREIELFGVIQRDMDPNNRDPWSAWFMDGRRQRIEDDAPFVDFDYITLAGYLRP